VSAIVFQPIGYVKSRESKSRRGSFSHVVSEIVLNQEFSVALEGLLEFSHIEVIYFMHMLESSRGWKPKVRPMGLQQLAEVGLFATRSPNRPNGIGLTLCELLSIENNTLTVRGLDALDGSPVLDIKGPSRRYYRNIRNMKFPEWTETLEP
jgi:tRNA-Thr(GGU) m(6)t(6)A37 methyltransferase TsaA